MVKELDFLDYSQIEGYFAELNELETFNSVINDELFDGFMIIQENYALIENMTEV